MLTMNGLLVLLSDPQLVFIELLHLFLHPDSLLKQLLLILTFQLTDPLFVALARFQELLSFQDDHLLFLCDFLVKLFNLLLRGRNFIF
jgi:hypothetical protein